MPNFYSEVYNQENKEWFLESIDLTQYPPRWWERVFEKSSMFEKIKDKDLYNFTTPDIIEFYKFLDIGTITPLIIYNTNLIRYAQWALNENLIVDGQNHFDELTSEILATCLNVTKTEQSILSYDTFVDLINRKIVNDQDKFIFFCLFEGIKGKNYQEIVDMKMSDIDENNLSVHLSSGRNVSVSPDFINICKKADKQTVYVGIVGNEIERNLVPGNNIVKEKSNSQGKNLNRTVYNTIVRNIAAVFELADVVTAKSIRDSGLIYYLNKRADKLGVSVSELMYDLNNWQDLIDKYQFNPDTRKRWLLQYKDFLH